METDLQLAAVLGGLSLRTRQRVDLPSLTGRWRSFVREVREGHASPESIADELAVRDLIAEVMASVRSETARQIGELVRADDEAYRACNRVVDNPRRSLRADRWWWTRIPAGLGNFTETTR